MHVHTTEAPWCIVRLQRELGSSGESTPLTGNTEYSQIYLECFTCIYDSFFFFFLFVVGIVVMAHLHMPVMPCDCFGLQQQMITFYHENNHFISVHCVAPSAHDNSTVYEVSSWGRFPSCGVNVKLVFMSIMFAHHPNVTYYCQLKVIWLLREYTFCSFSASH